MTGERTPNIDRVFPLPKERGPNGRHLCRVCRSVCPPRCTSYCSDECRGSAQIYWGIEYMKKFVYARDGGRCRRCGMDLAKLDRILYRHVKWPRISGVLAELGFDRHVHRLYHIDHIVPVCEGGLCEPANLRTLCHPCHKVITRLMHLKHKNRRLGPVLFTSGASDGT